MNLICKFKHNINYYTINMTTIVDNRYRKAAKKLREIERLKNKNSLNEEERNKLDNEVNYKLEAKTFKKFSFTLLLLTGQSCFKSPNK